MNEEAAENERGMRRHKAESLRERGELLEETSSLKVPT